jgi:hypothetical protein
MRTTVLLMVLLVALSCWLLSAGCGGGGAGPEAAPTGSFTMTVKFPPSPEEVQAAVIYAQTNSITVDVLDPVTRAEIVPRTTLNRPSPEGGQVSTTIAAVPVGTWLIRVQGWAEEDGAGNLLSRVYDTAVIVIAQTTTKNMVMEGYPFAMEVLALTNPVLVDQTTDVIATLKAVDGSTVLGTYEYDWASSDTSIAIQSGASSTDEAVFQGVARGSCNVNCSLVHDDRAPAQAPVTGTTVLNVDPNVDEAVVVPSRMTLASDTSDNATATAKYKGATVSNIEFTFVSSDTRVARATKTGSNTCRVDAIAGGTSTVNVTQPYTGASAQIAVMVPEGKMDVIISGADQP